MFHQTEVEIQNIRTHPLDRVPKECSEAQLVPLLCPPALDTVAVGGELDRPLQNGNSASRDVRSGRVEF